MSKFLLSVCVPTLNRVSFLESFIKNYIEELKYDFNGINLSSIVQLVIVDGASNDSSDDLIKKYAKTYNIKFLIRKKRVGIDKDIAKCIEISESEFAWLISDDDVITKGSILKLVEFLNTNREVDGCFLNRIPYDFSITNQVSEVSLWPSKFFKKNHFFTNKDECFTKIGMDFGFISSQVFNCKKWNDTFEKVKTDHLSDTYYLMVHIIASIMNNSFKWVYISDPLVIQRTGNDSLLISQGLYNRQKIEHGNFNRIILEHYEKGSKMYKKFFKKMVRRLPRVIANFKSQKINFSTQLKILKLYLKSYYMYKETWFIILPIFLTPNFIFVLLRSIYFNTISKN
jgi:abequosyltransferase